mmetsp:Transcript_143036/g.202331  ORF Transcript_143036/g.202331 Transcript_143036/m.202331 type:complete len:106 (+) Transcript_143036:476-793(+)
MLADVKTVALTAAGHLVAPAAGSIMESNTQAVIAESSARACQGFSVTSLRPSSDPECKPRDGGTRASGTLRNSDNTVSRETGMWVDFRAQTKAPAWKHPANIAKQ